MKVIKAGQIASALEPAAVVEYYGQVVSLIYEEPGYRNSYFVYPTAAEAKALFDKILGVEFMFLVNGSTAVNLSRADVIEARKKEKSDKGEVAFIFSNGVVRRIECADMVSAIELFKKVMGELETRNAEELVGTRG